MDILVKVVKMIPPRENFNCLVCILESGKHLAMRYNLKHS